MVIHACHPSYIAVIHRRIARQGIKKKEEDPFPKIMKA
jgi:hypothetical protein